jgi:hypothetical protein
MKSSNHILIASVQKSLPDCDQATRLSWQLIHCGLIPLRQRLALKSHLLLCPTCRSKHQHLKWLRDGIGNLSSR